MSEFKFKNFKLIGFTVFRKQANYFYSEKPQNNSNIYYKITTPH